MELSKTKHLSLAKDLYQIYGSTDTVANELIEKHNVIGKQPSLSRKLRRWLQKDKEENFTPSEQFKAAQEKKHDKKSKYFIITAAQNATNIHTQLFENIKAYADFLEASIEVIPIRYQNPTSVFKDKPHDWWDIKLNPYLIATRHKLNSNLTVLGDVKTQLTASTPLSGMEGLTGQESSILAHPRQHMTILPTLDNYPKKMMISTGVITKKNYTDSKAGKKAEFHHTYGFVVVEIKDNKQFFIRHVSALEDGSFIDLDTLVANGKVVPKYDNAVSAIVFGDLHLSNVCSSSLLASFRMLERFKPKNVILHDLLDGEAVNHHTEKSPFIRLKLEQEDKLNVEREIKDAVSFLETILPYNPIVVRSNHDKFIETWLNNTDWRKSINKSTYLKYASVIASGEAPNGILPYEIEKKFGNKVVCLSENDSFIINGIEVGQHGHLGASGSRGSSIQFKRFNIKMVTAHRHTPFRLDGVTGVGTLTRLRLGYNIGFSDWANSNVIINAHGKTQNLLIFDGNYSTL